MPGTRRHPELLRPAGGKRRVAAGREIRADRGDEDLRAAHAADLSRSMAGEIGPGEVAVTAGCNLAFFAAMMLSPRAGDAVLLPTPWYFNHQMALDMLGIEARALPCRPEAGFVPAGRGRRGLHRRARARDRARHAEQPDRRGLSGRDVIEAFAELCRRRGIWLVIDETYRDFLPAGAQPAARAVHGADWRGHVIQLYSFSKAYAIPGHRTGAITADAGPHRASSPRSSIACRSARRGPRRRRLPWAIEALRDWREANRAEINRRAAAFAAALAAAAGMARRLGRRLFRLSSAIRSRGDAPRAVAERLAVERGVLALPGTLFRARPGAASARRLRQRRGRRPGGPRRAPAGACCLSDTAR